MIIHRHAVPSAGGVFIDLTTLLQCLGNARVHDDLRLVPCQLHGGTGGVEVQAGRQSCEPITQAGAQRNAVLKLERVFAEELHMTSNSVSLH